ncbi:hypothetical protein JYU34_009111 [Plutella xylostella]|uniref:BHLH domain-containing protein n=1 Tax=Plutella xylostella TaxID=51655 RepID=A0ABQ7QN54_PLUXY|nr:hypothetical protein JYU34_009111 [Plutella xylostella]
MSLHGNDICLLEVEDYNLYEEEATDHAFIGGDKILRTGGKTMEAEKRIRREIANSNERRRMQSINAGFQALRTLLPRHEGEKLSKAAILQQTAEYIYSLEQEKTRLLSQNCQLKRLLNQHEGGEIPLKKRKSEILTHVSTIIPDSTEEAGAGRRSPDHKEGEEVRASLERERRLRRLLEQQVRALHAQLRPRDPAPSPPPPPPPLADLPALPAKLEPESEPEPPQPAEEPAAAPPAPALPALPVVVAPAEPAPLDAAPLLEAAIKAEPRVEVELLPETPARLYLASTSRQNLETIVEAIRHLEGDHLFGEPAGDVPLALTKKAPPPPRPGVIVVKHS